MLCLPTLVATRLLWRQPSSSSISSCAAPTPHLRHGWSSELCRLSHDLIQLLTKSLRASLYFHGIPSYKALCLCILVMFILIGLINNMLSNTLAYLAELEGIFFGMCFDMIVRPLVLYYSKSVEV